MTAKIPSETRVVLERGRWGEAGESEQVSLHFRKEDLTIIGFLR